MPTFRAVVLTGLEALEAATTLLQRIRRSHRTAGLLEAWLEAIGRPPVSSLHPGYTLTTRRETLDRPHHLIGRNGPDVEQRLRQTSLYRDELDLLVLDPSGEVAAYGLFWHDPVSATGLVEPMRTEDAHQRRGLARHLLTAGIDRLA